MISQLLPCYQLTVADTLRLIEEQSVPFLEMPNRVKQAYLRGQESLPVINRSSSASTTEIPMSLKGVSGP